MVGTMKKYHATTVPCERLRPHLQELINRCGSPTAAAEYALIGASTVYRIMHSYNCNMQRGVAEKILLALKHKREEDRENHEVHERLLKARKEQARIEDGQLRLLGY